MTQKVGRLYISGLKSTANGKEIETLFTEYGTLNYFGVKEGNGFLHMD